MELGTMGTWVRGNARKTCRRLTHNSLHSDQLRLNPTYSGFKKIKITSRVRFARGRAPGQNKNYRPNPFSNSPYMISAKMSLTRRHGCFRVRG
jgi:hypothetical protein